MRKMCFRIAPSLLLSIFLIGGAVEAQSIDDEIDATKEASKSLVSWIVSLIQVDDLVESAEREQLVHKLKDLRKDLYDLEQDKKFFLVELERQSLDHYQLNRAIEDFDRSIERVQRSVRDVGLALRENHRIGGIEVEGYLNRATMDRKSWVRRFEESISSGSPLDPSSHIQQGNEAVESLRQASIELSRLISKLEESLL